MLSKIHFLVWNINILLCHCASRCCLTATKSLVSLPIDSIYKQLEAKVNCNLMHEGHRCSKDLESITRKTNCLYANASLFVCITTYQPKNQPWADQTIALSLRGVLPFVTDVSDNLKKTTMLNSMFLHPLLLTPGSHSSHFKRHDSTINRHNLQHWHSKRAHTASQPRTNTGTQVVISELWIYEAGEEHISCLYLPWCNGRYDNRSAWWKFKQDAPLP